MASPALYRTAEATADKRDWCTAAPVFNISMALTDDGTLYVAGLDFIGRLQSQTGKFDWQIKGLWAKDKDLNIFRVPVIKGEDVHFVASATGSPPYKRVVVGRDNGKLKAIEVFSTKAGALPPDGPALQGTCTLN